MEAGSRNDAKLAAELPVDEEVYDDNYRFNDKEAKAEQFRQGLSDGLTVEQQNAIRARVGFRCS